MALGFGGRADAQTTTRTGNVCHAAEAPEQAAFVVDNSEPAAPFLFHGRTPKPDDRRFRSALYQFRDVRRCLKGSEWRSDRPDLAKFDWGRLKRDGQQEVCLFHVASRLAAPETVSDWLCAQGFSVAPLLQYRTPGRNDTEPVFDLSAAWSRERYRSVWPSLVERLTGFDQILGYEVHILFSATRQVVGVDATALTK